MTACPIAFELDGSPVTVGDDGMSLLEALREHLGVRSAKDGCSPQGQCGCCTVLVDGDARVACVTPLRRVAGRRVTTVDGLAEVIEDPAAMSGPIDLLVAKYPQYHDIRPAGPVIVVRVGQWRGWAAT